MPRIFVRNLQRKLPVSLSALQKSAEAALNSVAKIPRRRRTPLGNLKEIGVLLISNRRMSELHWRFMREHGPTDVITFDHGEIFVSVETAEENRRRFGTSLQRELELYVVHGLLHLNGFDDRKPADAKKMEKTQQKILSALK